MAATRQMMGSARMLRAARPSLYATPAYVSSSASASASCSAQQHRNGRAAGCSSNSSSSSSFCTSARASGPWSYSGKSNKPLHRYLVIAEDYPDPGALARRLEVRERHLEGAAEGIESGLIELGGGFLKRDFDQVDEEVGPASSMIGSLMVVLGESIEDVRSRVMQDEYVQAGVWDPSRLRILPFLRAVVASSHESKAAGHPAVGRLAPISRRSPKGESKIKRSLMAREEVYVSDPRASGLAIRQDDRQSAARTKASLGELRSQQDKKTGKGITLGSLRKGADKTPPVY